MRVAGIDPGITGAIVVLEDYEPIEWMMMPVVTVGTAKRVNGAELADFLTDNKVGFVCIENVHAMPGQGVTSMFNFGHSVGTIMGVLWALKIAHNLYSPQAWKKKNQLIGTDKDASRSAAIQLFPNWKELRKKAKGQALADAYFIGAMK